MIDQSTLSTEPTRVMISGDRAFLRYAPTCIAAIRACTPGQIEIGVVTTGISETNQAKLHEACAGVSLEFLTIDADQFSGLFLRPHLSPLSFARILMPNLTSWERFVYLDIDVIVQTDLRRLYQMDMAGKPVAAALENGEGINSGVLLVDAAAWRRESAPERLMSFVRDHRPWNADQDAIAAIFKDRILLIDPRWNVTVKLLWDPPARTSDEAMDEAFALHFISAFKPWNVGRYLAPEAPIKRWDAHFSPSGISRDWRHDISALFKQRRELLSWLKNEVYIRTKGRNRRRPRRRPE